MRIGVILRLVPDLGEDIEFNADGTALDMEWIDLKPNEYDEQALEEAILIAGVVGAEVVAMALAGDGVDKMLRTARAKGAARSVRIACDDECPQDSAQMAPVLVAAARALDIDLLLTGVQAANDATGPLAGRLAALLDWPSACAVAGVTAEAGRITVRQEYAGGRAAMVSLTLPAVLGIQSASAPMRYVSGSKMGEAMRAPLEELSIQAEWGDPGFRALALASNVAQRRAEMIEGAPDVIAARLRDLLAERGLWPGNVAP